MLPIDDLKIQDETLEEKNNSLFNKFGLISPSFQPELYYWNVEVKYFFD